MLFLEGYAIVIGMKGEKLKNKNVSERNQFEITGTHLERYHCLKVQQHINVPIRYCYIINSTL